jgi:hypothetical protein
MREGRLAEVVLKGRTAARWRRQVVPRADVEGRVCGHHLVGGRVPTRRVSWAQLLKRVFIEDVLRS